MKVRIFVNRDKAVEVVTRMLDSRKASLECQTKDGKFEEYLKEELESLERDRAAYMFALENHNAPEVALEICL